MWGFRVPVSVRLAWVLVRPAPVLSTLVSISLAQPETLAFQATAAALLTVSDLADRSGSKLDRQFLDQKAAVALANIIRQLWVVCRLRTRIDALHGILRTSSHRQGKGTGNLNSFLGRH